jgi:hypothetical protein
LPAISLAKIELIQMRLEDFVLERKEMILFYKNEKDVGH